MALATLVLVGVVGAIVTNLDGANGHSSVAGARAPLAPVRVSTPSPAPPAAASPPTSPADTAWREVDATGDGYALELPPGWTAASLRQIPVEEAVGASARVAAIVPAAVLRQMNASGSLFAFPDDHHDQFLAVSVAPAGAGIDDLSVTVPAELVSEGAASISEDLGQVSAGPALRVAYEMPAPEGRVHQLSFFVISNGRLYTLTFGTRSPARDNGLFNSIAATLRTS